MSKFNEYNSRNSEGVLIARSVLLGAAVGLCVSVLLLCASAAVIVKLGTLPSDYLPIITIIIGAAGAFVSGYTAVAMYKKRGLLTGLITGAVMFAAVFVTSLLSGSTDDLAGTLIKCGVFILMGSIGGVVRVNKREKVKRAR